MSDEITPTLVGEDRASGTTGHVDPEWIRAQRTLGWPDTHPEANCHRCGARNVVWCTDRQTWLTATSAWAAETGREGICCPTCLVDMFKEATGADPIWWFSPYDSRFQHLTDPQAELSDRATAELNIARAARPDAPTPTPAEGQPMTRGEVAPDGWCTCTDRATRIGIFATGATLGWAAAAALFIWLGA